MNQAVLLLDYQLRESKTVFRFPTAASEPRTSESKARAYQPISDAPKTNSNAETDDTEAITDRDGR